MDPIVLTGFVGVGLLVCGYLVGYSRGTAFSRYALENFVSEMITAKIIDPIKMNKHFHKE